MKNVLYKYCSDLWVKKNVQKRKSRLGKTSRIYDSRGLSMKKTHCSRFIKMLVKTMYLPFCKNVIVSKAVRVADSAHYIGHGGNEKENAINKKKAINKRLGPGCVHMLYRRNSRWWSKRVPSISSNSWERVFK